jgi:hypothetical protein
MPYEFSENAFEPEAQAASSRNMGPPRKRIGTDVLDTPGEALPADLLHSRPFWLAIALVVLAALVGIALALR